MNIIKQFTFSFMSTLGFAVLFNCPKDSIIHAGLVGSTGWMLYYFTFLLTNNYVAASFIGALTVGILGEILVL